MKMEEKKKKYCLVVDDDFNWGGENGVGKDE
jgi:hypothetical protein